MKKKTVTIGDKIVGPDAQCLLIAEVGTTCLGDIDKAMQLIDAAVAAGMDAIKFQLIDPEQISDKTVTYPMMVDGNLKQVNMYDMFKILSFSELEWLQIAKYSSDRGILFFATVDSIEGVDILERVGVSVHKIGAWDTTYRSLIEHIALTKKPMFVDLGPTTQEEIDDLVKWYKDNGGTSILFMHDFHTQNDNQMNLRAIDYLNITYNWPAGFSSPGLDHDLDLAALALDASYIEKRLVLSRKELAFHSHESLEPEELKNWVIRIRHVERALGKPLIIPSSKDLEDKNKYYRSICTLTPIKAGELLSKNNIGSKRPGNGIPTKRLLEFYGKKARHDLLGDALLLESDVI